MDTVGGGTGAGAAASQPLPSVRKLQHVLSPAPNRRDGEERAGPEAAALELAERRARLCSDPGGHREPPGRLTPAPLHARPQARDGFSRLVGICRADGCAAQGEQIFLK